MQLELRDLKGAQATCDEMRKIENLRLELIRYYEARIKLGENNVLEATREMEAIRPAVERLGPEYFSEINGLLGRCYAVLGRTDQQLEVYRRLLATYPAMAQARVGEAAALQALGRHKEAETSVTLLRDASLADGASFEDRLRPDVLQLVVNQEMTKPAEDRNWDVINQLAAKVFQLKDRTPLQNDLLKSELLIAQGESDQALEILSALRKEHPKEAAVWMALCKLMNSEEKYRSRLPQLLALAEKEAGNIPQLHAERIRVAATTGGEKTVEQLKKLEAGISEYDEAQRQSLLALLATAYLQAGDYEDSKALFQGSVGPGARQRPHSPVAVRAGYGKEGRAGHG